MTTRARYSRFTWWTMPVSGGTTLKLWNAVCPQREERVALAGCARTRARALMRNASRVPNSSTCTEWSMTSSTGCSGLIFFGSPPSVFIASRIAARSTTAGTPVKSCSSTRAGVNAISRVGLRPSTSTVASASMSSARDRRRRPRCAAGSRAGSSARTAAARPAGASRRPPPRRKYEYEAEPTARVRRAEKESGMIYGRK